MIFDGRWKWELKKLSWAISLWKKALRYGEYGKHQLNRAVLYSATVLRKAIEDEIEAEKSRLNVNAVRLFRFDIVSSRVV